MVTGTEKYCRKCGHTVPANTQRCPGCGWLGPHLDHSPILDEDRPTHCRFCKVQLPADLKDNHCPNCGKVVIYYEVETKAKPAPKKTTQYCPRCRTAVEADATRCPSCGWHGAFVDTRPKEERVRVDKCPHCGAKVRNQKAFLCEECHKPIREMRDTSRTSVERPIFVDPDTGVVTPEGVRVHKLRTMVGIGGLLMTMVYFFWLRESTGTREVLWLIGSAMLMTLLVYAGASMFGATAGGHISVESTPAEMVALYVASFVSVVIRNILMTLVNRVAPHMIFSVQLGISIVLGVVVLTICLEQFFLLKRSRAAALASMAFVVYTLMGGWLPDLGWV